MFVTKLLGEELDNPQVTFTLLENDFDARIKLLSYKLYQNAKELTFEQQNNDDLKIKINKETKYLGESYFYAITQHMNNLKKQIDDEKNLAGNLQKEINHLKNFNEQLMNAVIHMNKKLDQLERDMGIALKMKRMMKIK
jgi:hypothetical protein